MLGINIPSIQITLAGINASIIVERQFLKLGEEAFKMMMVTDGANCRLVFAQNIRQIHAYKAVLRQKS